MIEQEKGSALIYVLISAILLTSTLLVILNYYHLQQRLIDRKGYLLQTKYSAEGAIYHYLQKMEDEWGFDEAGKIREAIVTISPEDTARIQSICWGGFLFISSAANKRSEKFYLEVLAGVHPTSAFDPAVIVNPNSGPLILSGRSRIQGDVLMGAGGIRKGRLWAHEFNRELQVLGNILETSIDPRPAIDLKYLATTWKNFQALLADEDTRTFPEIMQDTARYFAADSSVSWWEQPVYITNQQFNQKNWHLRGPLILIANEELILKNNLILEHYIQIFSSHSITVQGQGSTFHEVLLYSPEKVVLKGTDNFCGQIFSDQAIEVQDKSRLHYPTLLTVKSSSDSGFILVDSASAIAGNIILISKNNQSGNAQNQSKIFIEGGAVVDGLVWSDNYTQVHGEVNGLVITDQFYEYDPPTIYRNWIMDGIIIRKQLNNRFRLPLFFRQNQTHLTLLDER